MAASDLTAVDPDDPCAVAKALRAALFTVLAGQNESRVRFRNGDIDEDVTYGTANIPELRKELVRQDSLCAVARGGRPARRCITAG